MRIIHLLTIIAYLISTVLCYGQNRLEQDSTLTNVFDASELKDLNILLELFDNHVCEEKTINPNNLSDAYQNFMARLLKRSNETYFQIKLPFEKQLKAYEKMKPSIFKEIWVFGKSWQHNSTDTLKYIYLNYEGKYYRFLKDLATDYDLIKWYCESYDTMADMSPWMVQNLLVNYKDYNTKDIRVRLFIAIHYLTLNDQHRRKEKT